MIAASTETDVWNMFNEVISQRVARLVVVSLLLTCSLLYSDEVSRRPNVLFIITDDQSFETIRALGHTDIETPNLDRLVEQGTTFTHCYNMGGWGGAICVCSRTMLITGKSLWRAWDVYKATDKEREKGVLWPQLMERQGYDTFFAGKWHILTDPKKVFRSTGTIRGGMPGVEPRPHYQRPREGEPDSWSPFDESLGGFWEGGQHWSEVVGEEAVHFLKKERKKERPFFMYTAFNAPHDPRQSPREYVEKYPVSRMGLPENYLPEYPFAKAMGCTAELRDENLAPFPRTEYAVKVQRGEYYAIISHLDTQVGKILDALEASGEKERTWIFFTSDHGLAVGHHGLFGKQNMYEHSLRVPFLVVGPGVKAGRKISAPIYLQDVMPTALELAEGVPSEQVEFQSLLPMLKEGGVEKKGRGVIYGAYMAQQRAVISGGWKLIVYPDAPVVRLYHVAEDPHELRDLSADPGQSERKKSLMKLLQEQQRELEDKLDLTGIAATL